MVRNHRLQNRIMLLSCVVGATLLAAFLPTVAQEAFAFGQPQTRARKHAPSKAAPQEPRKQMAVPFHVEEKLNYDVSWSSFTTAATVELSIPEQRDLYGWQTWHFRATAHTVSPVRTLFAIDDEFDSYTDATTLESRIYQTYLNEMGRKADEMWQFIPEGQTPRAPGPAVVVLAGTRDPLGALYAMRSVNWQNEKEASSPVYDGHHLYKMIATKEATGEPVEVPAGKFSATRIGIQVLEQNKPVSGVHFVVWLADDSARTPVLMRAEMPFGTLRIEMTASSTP